MIKDYILPLGTVVTLKNGDIKLMIVGRAQLFNDEGTIGYFDYSALGYPQGVVSESEYAFFNDEDIEEVMRDKGLILDDCYYMASESPIDIEEL